ncbi:MAG TPA: hypothetical protein VE173_15610, partial [Longimicrobiales bacterium]|nr:hypothetical protein [Longimicrobiales bacterium]
EVVKRVFDANLQYWETLNRATSEYVQTLARAWSEAPFTWSLGPRGERPTPAPEPPASRPRFAPALLLEGPAGAEARAVIVVRNDLSRQAEAPVVSGAFTGPGGEPVELDLRADPATVTVPPGEQVPVTLAVAITADMPEGGAYRGEVDVPGLSERGVPVVVRRRERRGEPAPAGEGAGSVEGGAKPEA